MNTLSSRSILWRGRIHHAQKACAKSSMVSVRNLVKPLLDTSVDLATSVEHHQPWFLNSSNVVIKEKDITTSMKDLVRQVSFLVQERKDKNIPPGSDDDPIIQLFRRTWLPSEEWSRYAFFDSSRPYTRNLIATDHVTYTLLLLCWNPQKESPIHDHPCDGCWLKVLKGTIRECRYSENLECTSDQSFGEGQIAYITDNMGYHKIGNPTLHQPAVSLHLYAPPIHQCRTWQPVDQEIGNHVEGMICQPCKSTNYSEYGFRIT